MSGTLRRAFDWAAGLDVNPLRLRDELDMKGVKHFVEYLHLLKYIRRSEGDSALGRAAERRALEVLSVVDDPRYHQLAAVDDLRFRQDSMSYLRACVLAEEFGHETDVYRREIARVFDRFLAALPSRGVDQRMGFAHLFEALGLPLPETQADIYDQSLIARRVPLDYYFVSADRPYDITHEIFAMTRRGGRPFPFRTQGEEAYAKDAVRQLLLASVRAGNIDLAAEFLVNLAYLGEARSDLARRTRRYLLSSQSADGSYGIYDQTAARRAKKNPRYDVRLGGTLHTTMVVVWALVETEPP